MSQNISTITNVSTVTSSVFTNSYTTETIGATTVTTESTTTIASDTLTLQQGAPHTCYYHYYNVTIDPGTTEVLGTLGPPNIPLDFFIMNMQQYKIFKSGKCGQGYEGIVTEHINAKSTHSLDWKNPPPGWYLFIFSNEDTNTPSLTIPFVIWITYTETSVSTIYTVMSSQLLLTATETVTSLQTTSVSSGTEFLSSPILIGAVIVVIAAILGALLYSKSRRARPLKTPDARIAGEAATLQRVAGEPSAKQPPKQAEDVFCIQCGVKLALGSKFCKKCGAKQG